MRQMLINARDPDLVRVAIVGEDGRLDEIDFESADSQTIKGNLYKARVVRVEPALQAAFVDYGAERNGFLPLSEVSGAVLTELQKKGKKKRTFEDEKLEKGQEVLVQVTREAMGPKGAAMTTYVALPGRYLVYLAGGESGGVSRKIDSADKRAKLNEIVRSLKKDKDIGLIVRTAGLSATKTELQKDFRFLEKLWKNIAGQYQSSRHPGIVWRDYGAIIRAVRDYYTADIERIWVDERETFEEVRRFAELSMSGKVADCVELYERDMPLFSHFGVERQLDHMRERKVELPSGGSIVIDQTEALVAIDVNSGKLRGEKGIEDTAFKTNCEAAREAARQLRLRNLGGIIVIDFIDMRDRKNRANVEKELKDAVKPDKANTTLGKIGRFGTLEMLRQRMRTSGARTGFVSCPHCNGSGLVPSPQLAAVDALREIRASAAGAPQGAEIRARVAEAAGNFLLNERRARLVELEASRAQRIVIEPTRDLSLEAPPIIRVEGGSAGPGRAQSAPEKTPDPHGNREGRSERKDERRNQTRAQKSEADKPEKSDEREASPNGERTRKKRRRGSRGGRNRRKRNEAAAAAQAAKPERTPRPPASPPPPPRFESTPESEREAQRREHQARQREARERNQRSRPPRQSVPEASAPTGAGEVASGQAKKTTAKKTTKKTAKKTPKKAVKKATKKAAKKVTKKKAAKAG